MHLLSPFAKELIKISASVDELQEAYRRINPTRVPARTTTGKNVRWAGGGAHVPTVKQTLAPRALLDSYNSLPGYEEIAASRAEPRRQSSLAKNFGGRTLSVPGGAVGSQNYLRSRGQPLPAPPSSGQGQRAVNISTGLHEGFEKGVRSHRLAPGFGHHSPDVLMKEHNMLQKMTGPGADEARSHFKKLRDVGGDADALMGTVRELYGPRGEAYVKEHGFSKAMRKNLTRQVRGGKQTSWPAPSAESLQKLKGLLQRRRLR